MSDYIQLLPDSIANQIAAGEVVQRPASVVKELLENAVDAGATRIQLIVKDAGKTLIKVVDDGCGMSYTDARMSFERHATSKIQKSEDLFAIRTMGFRGEALASIAAVAQVELRTRRRNEDLGTLVVVEGSKLITHEPCQQEPGTSIAVKNLFFNVPARRNFLKSDQVEKKHLVNEFQRVAISHPGIFFTMHYNDIESFHLPDGNLRQRLKGLFYKKINERLVPVQEGTDMIKISGFVGKPSFAKKTRGEQFFFVNDRYIKSGYLNHAIVQAYDKLLPHDAHPLYVLFIDIDPAHIDINVHPTKQEIKFDDEKMVYQVLRVAVKYALGQHHITPSLDFEDDVNFGKRLMEKSSPPTPETKSQNEPTSWGRIQSPSTDPNLANWRALYDQFQSDAEQPNATIDEQNVITLTSRMDDENEPSDDESITPVHASLFQIHQQYIISPIASGFLLIDQQAASERVLYEQYLHTSGSGKPVVQTRLFPQTIELPLADADLLRELLPQVRSLGFDIQEFGQQTFVIQGLPADFNEEKSEQAMVEEILHAFQYEVDMSLQQQEKLAAVMAKSAAIRKGHRLAPQEMQTLIDRLFACEAPNYSPSGKRCFITMTLQNLEKKFSHG